MLLAAYDRATRSLSDLATELLPLAARLVFAGVLLAYFWSSALTKLGPGALGFLSPSVGAYAQIFPKTFEAAGYDPSQLSAFHWAVATAGLWAEFLLPALIVAGLFTRLAALGMAGFIMVQSLTDIFGHGADAETVGRWFDAASGALIADQRALWLLLLLVLVLKGAGSLSIDRLLTGAARTVAGRPQVHDS
jgi:putative oxidoreductase